LDTPHGDFVEISSSSYNLSLFSSKSASYDDGVSIPRRGSHRAQA
jgi:hypothetical protein